MAIFSLKSKEVLSNLTAPANIDLGAMIPLMTTTLSSNATSVTFSNIPQNYEHLQIRAIARTDRAADTQDAINMRFNSDSGSNYSWHYISGNGSSVSSGAGSSASYIFNSVIGTAASSTAGMFGVSIIDILDYSNVNKYKTSRVFTGNDANGNGLCQIYSGSWRDLSSINTITFIPNVGSNIVQYSKFALYGIKRAGA
jgi:hypothetical protein